jgi:hypothetical protein
MTSNGQTTYLIEGFVIDSARGLITQDGKELYLRPRDKVGKILGTSRG